jgi:hypothetical protein
MFASPTTQMDGVTEQLALETLVRKYIFYVFESKPATATSPNVNFFRIFLVAVEFRGTKVQMKQNMP